MKYAHSEYSTARKREGEEREGEGEKKGSNRSYI